MGQLCVAQDLGHPDRQVVVEHERLVAAHDAAFRWRYARCLHALEQYAASERRTGRRWPQDGHVPVTDATSAVPFATRPDVASAGQPANARLPRVRSANDGPPGTAAGPVPCISA